MADDKPLTITEFTIGAAHTVNLGNYNNIKIEAAITVLVPVDGDFANRRQQAQGVLRTMLEETYKAQRRGGNGQQGGQTGQQQRQPGEEG